jgi:two-component system, response regulator PdtaR
MPAALVIEHDVILRNVVRSVLVGHGFEILDAANATEALTLCESLREPPLDLLIVDYSVGGAAPAGGIRNIAAQIQHLSPGIKVLVISECPYQFVKENGIPEGAWFLQKPFTAAQLLEMVGTILQPRIQ